MDRVTYDNLISVGNIVVTIFLVDGFARGRWKVEQQGASATLIIEPFEPLSPAIQNELQEEGARLMRWILAGAETFDIQFHENR